MPLSCPSCSRSILGLGAGTHALRALLLAWLTTCLMIVYLLRFSIPTTTQVLMSTAATLTCFLLISPMLTHRMNMTSLLRSVDVLRHSLLLTAYRRPQGFVTWEDQGKDYGVSLKGSICAPQFLIPLIYSDEKRIRCPVLIIVTASGKTALINIASHIVCWSTLIITCLMMTCAVSSLALHSSSPTISQTTTSASTTNKMACGVMAEPQMASSKEEKQTLWSQGRTSLWQRQVALYMARIYSDHGFEVIATLLRETGDPSVATSVNWDPQDYTSFAQQLDDIRYDVLDRIARYKRAESSDQMKSQPQRPPTHTEMLAMDLIHIMTKTAALSDSQQLGEAYSNLRQLVRRTYFHALNLMDSRYNLPLSKEMRNLIVTASTLSRLGCRLKTSSQTALSPSADGSYSDLNILEYLVCLSDGFSSEEALGYPPLLPGWFDVLTSLPLWQAGRVLLDSCTSWLLDTVYSALPCLGHFLPSTFQDTATRQDLMVK